MVVVMFIIISFSAMNWKECERRASVGSKRTWTSDSAWRTHLVHVRHTTLYTRFHTIFFLLQYHRRIVIYGRK